MSGGFVKFWEILIEKIAAKIRDLLRDSRAKEFFKAGFAKVKNGDKAGAIEDFNKAIALAPDYEDAYAYRGAMMAALGKLDEAMADFEKAISISKICETAYLGRAVEKQKMGDFERALDDYLHVYLINKKKYLNQFKYVMSVGVCEMELGHFDRAEKFFSQAINLNPNSDEAYEQRGYARHRLANYKGAIEDYDKAIALKPPNVAAVIEKANVKDHMGDYYGALADYKYALDLVGENSDVAYFVFFNMAVAKSRHGDIVGAVEDLKKCLKIRPNDPKTEKFMAQLMPRKSEEHGKHAEYR